MRKLTLLVVVLVLILPFGVIAAQDDAVSCSPQEIALVGEALAIYSEALTELDAISSDVSDNDFGAALVGYDAFSYEFWNTLAPEFPACVEAQKLTLIFGIAFDELATAASFANIMGWSEALEATEAIEYFAEATAIRVESVTAMMEMAGELEIEDYLEELESCSVEEYEMNSTLLGEYFAEMESVFADIGETSTDDIEAITGIVVAADIYSNGYWNEIYPELPYCAEADLEAYTAGAIVDELVLITSLGLNAALEDAAGNTETAELLAASVAVRYEELIAFLDSME